MKRSDLYESFWGIRSNIVPWYHNNGCPSWDILDYNLVKPITPSVIIKRYVHET